MEQSATGHPPLHVASEFTPQPISRGSTLRPIGQDVKAVRSRVFGAPCPDVSLGRCPSVLVAWVACMGLLVQRAYLQASAANLATDLARYGTAAQWRGVYYRGEKVGFTVSQVVPADDGFELQEDGRLQMSLLGATTPAVIKTDGARGPGVRAAVVRLLARSRHRPAARSGHGSTACASRCRSRRPAARAPRRAPATSRRR